jgi:hypothetical protein
MMAGPTKTRRTSRSRPGELYEWNGKEWMRRRLRQASQGMPRPLTVCGKDRLRQGPFRGKVRPLQSTMESHESAGTCPEDGLPAGALLCPVRTCS